MDRTPAVVGLTLCDLVIDEAITHKLSLVGSFTEILVDELPGLAGPFAAVAFLTDAQGVIDLTLRVSDARTSGIVYTQGHRVYSPNPLAVVYCNIRVRDCSFPRPGIYLFSLWAGPELLAERRAAVRRGSRP